MTPNREDYLKLILELGGDKEKVSNKKSLQVYPFLVLLSVR